MIYYVYPLPGMSDRRKNITVENVKKVFCVE